MADPIRRHAGRRSNPRVGWVAAVTWVGALVAATGASAQVAPLLRPAPHTVSKPGSQPDKAAQGAQAVEAAKQLRLAIAKCWSSDAAAAPELATKTVQIEFIIKRNGDVVGVPRVLNRRGEPTPVALAQSAVRAIQACAPYTNLPTEAFDKGVLPARMTFDARGF
jgi:hypothetical protein